MYKIKKSFFKNNAKVFLWSFLIIFVEFIYFTYTSFPEAPLYPVRHRLQNLIVNLNPTHVAKAKIYLSESQRLQKHLTDLQSQKISETIISSVATELISQEQAAINHMDLAKKVDGSNIKSQVEVLCDTLIKQYPILKQSVANATLSKSLLERSLNQTKLNIDESSGW